MRTYKSIEQPSQVLGIDINNLFIVMGFIVVGAILVGLLGMVMDIHWIVYVLLLLISVSLFILFKYLAKHRPPGFAMGFVSYHLRQPKRLTIGLPRNAQAKAKLLASAKLAAGAKAGAKAAAVKAASAKKPTAPAKAPAKPAAKALAPVPAPAPAMAPAPVMAAH